MMAPKRTAPPKRKGRTPGTALPVDEMSSSGEPSSSSAEGSASSSRVPGGEVASEMQASTSEMQISTSVEPESVSGRNTISEEVDRMFDDSEGTPQVGTSGRGQEFASTCGGGPVRKDPKSRTHFAAHGLPTSLKPKDIPAIGEAYRIPESIPLMLPGPDLDAGSPPEGMVAFGLQSLKVGVRFPLSSFLRAVLTFHRIAPHQLHPNGYGCLLGLEKLFSTIGKDWPTMEELMAFYELRDVKDSPGFYSFYPIAGKVTFGENTSIKHWRDQYFYTTTAIDSDHGDPQLRALDLSFGHAG